MAWFTIIASAIVLVAFAGILYTYQTTSPMKIFLAIVLAIFAIIYIINICRTVK